jgi:hypothetical protein
MGQIDNQSINEFQIIFCGFPLIIAVYLLHARTVEPQEQPLLSKTRLQQ